MCSPGVGSSAITHPGRQASPRADTSRWFMPPLIWKEYWFRMRSGSSKPKRRSSSAAWASASLRFQRPWVVMASVSWRRSFITGSREAPGFWGMRPMAAPRSLRSRRRGME